MTIIVSQASNNNATFIQSHIKWLILVALQNYDKQLLQLNVTTLHTEKINKYNKNPK